MTDPPQDSTAGRDLTDLLIAISVVARHLARKLEDRNRNDPHAPAVHAGSGTVNGDRRRKENP